MLIITFLGPCWATASLFYTSNCYVLLGSLRNEEGDGNENEQKQSLCTCVLHFCAFLYRPLQNNNVAGQGPTTFCVKKIFYILYI